MSKVIHPQTTKTNVSKEEEVWCRRVESQFRTTRMWRKEWILLWLQKSHKYSWPCPPKINLQQSYPRSNDEFRQNSDKLKEMIQSSWQDTPTEGRRFEMQQYKLAHRKIRVKQARQLIQIQQTFQGLLYDACLKRKQLRGTNRWVYEEKWVFPKWFPTEF